MLINEAKRKISAQCNGKASFLSLKFNLFEILLSDNNKQLINDYQKLLIKPKILVIKLIKKEDKKCFNT